MNALWDDVPCDSACLSSQGKPDVPVLKDPLAFLMHAPCICIHS